MIWTKKRNLPAILLSMLLLSCALCTMFSDSRSFAADETDSAVYEAAGWQISLEDSVRTSSLNTVSVSLGYSSVETTDLEQSAAEGYEYCLLKLSFVKVDSTEVIAWDNVVLTDGDGNCYSRIDDSFISDYDMSRLPGTDLNFGSYEGWICFEILETAENLTLICSFEEEELAIQVADVDSTENETEAETEAGTESATEAEPETEMESAAEISWTEIDYEDYLEEQAAIDDALYAEAQSGYSFEAPFVVVNPYQNSPLTAMVIFTTSEETGVEVVVCGKDGKNNITTTFEAETTHILPIYGLYAGDTTEVVLTLDDGTSSTLEITTEALDSSLTEAEVTVCEEAALDILAEDELTFAFIQSASEGASGVVAYDNAGDIRWYMDEEYVSAFSMKRLSNGRMMASTAEVISGYYYSTGLVEFDLCGKFYAIYLIPGGEHHDFVELSNGNLLVCSCTEDFSSVEDRIVEIDRETGEVVYELNIADLIEPGDGGSVNATEDDWCHNNSIDYDEETDTILLSCRHLDAVLAVNKTEKELVWILGDPSGFTSVSEDLFFTPVDEDGDFEWQYAQHNATFLPDGDILLFDNGTHRTKVGAEDEGTTGDDVYSRAVRYHIDTENMTIEQVWSYGEDRGKEWYSSYISGADYLDEDTYWVTSGSNSYSTELETYDLTVAQSTQGVLCTYIDLVVGDELLYEMTIPASTYRSMRAALYTEENTYSVTEKAVWYGSLGSVAQADAEELTVTADGETAALADFLAVWEDGEENITEYLAAVSETAGYTLSELVETPDRVCVSGSWQETGEDASLVLINESGDICRFAIEASSAQTSESEESFSLWITADSVTAGHRYYIYLYNEGVLYATGTYWNVYVDTRESLEDEGAQEALYDVDGRVYTVVSAETTETETDDAFATLDIVETEDVPAESENVETEAADSDQVETATEMETTTDGTVTDLEASVDVEEATVITAMDMETELTMPEQTQAISDAIVAEVEANGYTFDDPLVILNPYQNTPLTAVVAFVTDDACEVRVTVKGKTEEQDITDMIDAAALHIIPVLGLYAAYDNEVVLELLDADGNVTGTTTVTITTEALPSSLQGEVEVDTYTTESSMGLMLVSGLSAPYAYAFDETGEIRWYCTVEWEYYGLFLLENGHFLIEAENVLYPNASMPNSCEFWEMDYLGRVYNVYYFPEGVHHDIQEMTPDGNFLILTNSNDGYEQNMIQEIDRETGEVVKSLNLNELFAGLDYIDRDDWCHTNTVSYDEETDTILISCRNLHSVIRIDWSTDEILWILADPTVWEGTGYEDKVLTATEDFQWQYQQHAAYALEEDLDGNPDTVEIMLFDNHYSAYRKVSTYDYTQASYVKIYSVNAEEMTVTLLKNYETAYSVITSNAFYDSDANRVFSVNAYLSTYLNTTNRGEIYEIDYESGKILNSWKITHRFYRGYSVSFSLNDCAGAFELSDNYIRGTLRMPVEVDAEDAVRITDNETLSTDTVSFTLRGDVLYMEGSDHMYTQIIFNGTEHTYVYDITDIKSQSSDVDSYRYEIPIPLGELEADTYTIQVMYNDELYNIEGSFTIS